MIITSKFFSFNMWEWFLHSLVLERTESNLSKINWLRGVILLNPIVLAPWGRFPLCHTPTRPISAFRDQISILIVGCVTTWSRGSHHKSVKHDPHHGIHSFHHLHHGLHLEFKFYIGRGWSVVLILHDSTCKNWLVVKKILTSLVFRSNTLNILTRS
jgi:hypothetical protein